VCFLSNTQIPPMEKIRIIILLLFLLPFSAQASSPLSVSILNWQEDSLLTASGKTSGILVEGKAKNLSPRQVINSFLFGLNKERNLKITQVTCDGKPANYSFVGNSLNIKFDKPKKNGDPISIYFSYEEKYSKIHKFLRQEMIQIPPFASGANAKVIMRFPGFLESATLNPNVTKNGNSFIYRNIVPQNGVQELIKLTSAGDAWDAVARVKISSNQALENAVIKMPVYFQNSGQKVENSVSESSVKPLKQYLESGKKAFEFKTTAKEITVENRARIFTGENARTQMNRDPNKYKKFTQEESNLLAPLLDYIKQNPQYKNLPLHAKIGKFVHDYIKYDLRYTSKMPAINEILQNRAGVCTEYAKLYDGFARIAGIPSIVVNGVACGEYNKCQGHAWNKIYVDEKWIDVDPTWDLMSGIVSSSHIYFSDSDNNDAEVRYSGSRKTVKSEMDFEIRNVVN
jgi:hypothetical protein